MANSVEKTSTTTKKCHQTVICAIKTFVYLANILFYIVQISWLLSGNKVYSFSQRTHKCLNFIASTMHNPARNFTPNL